MNEGPIPISPSRLDVQSMTLPAATPPTFPTIAVNETLCPSEKTSPSDGVVIRTPSSTVGASIVVVGATGLSVSHPKPTSI